MGTLGVGAGVGREDVFGVGLIRFARWGVSVAGIDVAV